MLQKIIQTDNAATTILIFLMVGAIFLSEGIKKFLFADKSGVDRFEKIGLPNPGFLRPFVGGFEIICRTGILIGLFTRVAAVPLIIIMITAISTTKIRILINEGFWTRMHESRTDWAMVLSCVFLLIKGGGRWSVDRKITTHRWI